LRHPNDRFAAPVCALSYLATEFGAEMNRQN
jgi:hypothetical protein